MKTRLKGSVALLTAVLLLVSCSAGLVPAWKAENGTVLSLSFGTLPSPGGRAIIQGGGYLYIQTGLLAADAVLHGPYQIKAGESLEVLDIPAGQYPFIALVYADGIKPDAKPITIASNTDADTDFRAALLAGIGVPSRFSYRLLKDVQIVSGQVNEVKASLIPLTDVVYNGTYSSLKIVYPTLPSTGGDQARMFVRIDNVGAGIPAGTFLTGTKIIVDNSTGTAQFGRLDLFRADGSLFKASQIASQVLAPASSVTPVTMANDGIGQYYAYVEYSGTTVSLAQEYSLITNLVAVSADGSARCTLDGVTWGGPYPTGLASCTSITYGGGLYVAGGTIGGAYGLTTSPDGKNWTARTLPGAPPATIRAIKTNPAGQLLAVTNIGATDSAYTSSDGIIWAGPSSVTYPTAEPAWLDGKWYITNSNGSVWKSSPDGAVWTSTGGTSSMYQINTIAGINGNLVVGGGASVNAAKQVKISTNYGASFGSLLPVASATDYILAFDVTDTGRLISVGSGSGMQINYSDDNGATWNPSTTTFVSAVNAVCWTPFGIFAGGAGATIHRSTDNGASFSLSGPASAAVTGIAYRH